MSLLCFPGWMWLHLSVTAWLYVEINDLWWEQGPHSHLKNIYTSHFPQTNTWEPSRNRTDTVAAASLSHKRISPPIPISASQDDLLFKDKCENTDDWHIGPVLLLSLEFKVPDLGGWPMGIFISSVICFPGGARGKASNTDQPWSIFASDSVLISCWVSQLINAIESD